MSIELTDEIVMTKAEMVAYACSITQAFNERFLKREWNENEDKLLAMYVMAEFDEFIEYIKTRE